MTTATKTRRPGSKSGASRKSGPTQTDLEDFTRAAPAALDVRMVDVVGLAVAPENVRAHRPPTEVEALAANILAHGLIQPLVGYEADGRLFITCGARRLAALRHARLTQAPVIVRDRADAVAQSLAENTHRTAMHPADEARAWGRMVAEGEDPVRIANAFGVRERYVLQRLKLSRLHAPILEALAADEIGIERAQAWAAIGEERQPAIWARLGARADSWSIRRAAQDGAVEGDDRLAKLVGAEAYLGAGGRIEQDLFAPEPRAGSQSAMEDDDDDWSDGGAADLWLDREIIERLAAEALERKAEELRAEGWGFAEIVEDASSYHLPNGYVAAPGKPARSKAARAERGCLICVDWQGEIFVRRDVLRRGSPAHKAALGQMQDETDGDLPEAVSHEPAMTTVTHERLTRTASAIVGMGMIARPETALTALVCQLARGRFGERGFGRDAGALAIRFEWPGQCTGVPVGELVAPESAPTIATELALLDTQWSIRLEKAANDAAREGVSFETVVDTWPLEDRLALLAFLLSRQVQMIETQPPTRLVEDPDDAGDIPHERYDPETGEVVEVKPEDVHPLRRSDGLTHAGRRRARLAALGALAGVSPGELWTPGVEIFKGFSRDALEAAADELGVPAGSRPKQKGKLAEACAARAAEQGWVPALVRELTGAA